MDRKELMQAIETGRAELEAVLAQISPQQMEATVLPGGWSGKDALAHIEYWERRVARLYDFMRGPDREWDEDDVDTINARVYRENQKRSLTDVRQGEQDAYRALLAMIEGATDEELFNPNHFASAEGHPFADWIEGNMHGHYAEHLSDLRKLI